MDAAQEGVRETNRAANVGEELGYLGEPWTSDAFSSLAMARTAGGTHPDLLARRVV